VKDKEEFNPKGRQTGFTLLCLGCRDIQKRSEVNPTTEKGKCKAAWLAWRQENSKCLHCGLDDAKVIEADHTSVKVRECSDATYWSNHGGVEAQKKESTTTQPLCRFCHSIKTKKEKPTTKRSDQLDKYAIVDAEKMNRRECLHCERVVTKDTVRAFYFVHRDQSTLTISIGKLVKKSWAFFMENKDPEMAKCDLLCANCFASNGYGKKPCC
jgi:hypothetical protein